VASLALLLDASPTGWAALQRPPSLPGVGGLGAASYVQQARVHVKQE